MTARQVFQKIANLITARKKKLAPRKKGYLANSIEDRVIIKRDGTVQIASKMLKYGYYQDAGARGSKRAFSNGYQPKSYKNKFTRKNNMSLYAPGQFKSKYAGRTTNFQAWRAQVAYWGFKPQPFIKPAVLGVMDQQGYDMIAEYISEDVALQFKNTFKRK
tara:strand:+ start:761 stop:1243 length:483 start_codon:yes stop_codon:yes gene_type:complete